MLINKPLILSGASGTTAYTIDQSLRFDSTANVNLIDSSVGAGDTRKKDTFSVWVKRGKLGLLMYIMAYRYDATNYQYMSFDTSNRLEFTDVSGGSVIGKLITNRVFRDPSAWYNLTFVWDTANAVAQDRMRIYVNGVRETSFNTATYPSLNVDSGGAGRASSDIRIGTYYAIAGTFFDGYMANIVYIDNGALDPSSFGETNDNGIWIPKDVSGLTFGSRGFYVDGRDASDLGDDESGNGNDFSSGLSAHDQVLDSPTNNFAVMNPLSNYYASSTFAEGNLKVTHGGSSIYTFNESTMAMTSGKWYAEVDVDAMDSTLIGVAGQSSGAASHILGTKTDQVGYYGPDGNYYKNNSATSYGNSYATGDIIGIALDLDNNKLYFSKNGTFQNSGVPTSGATGTGAISIPAASATYNFSYTFAFGDFSNSSATSIANFGQDGTFAGNVTAGGNSDGNGIGNFKYSVPSGYLALCTKNLGS